MVSRDNGWKSKSYCGCWDRIKTGNVYVAVVVVRSPIHSWALEGSETTYFRILLYIFTVGLGIGTVVIFIRYWGTFRFYSNVGLTTFEVFFALFSVWWPFADIISTDEKYVQAMICENFNVNIIIRGWYETYTFHI